MFLGADFLNLGNLVPVFGLPDPPGLWTTCLSSPCLLHLSGWPWPMEGSLPDVHRGNSHGASGQSWSGQHLVDGRVGWISSSNKSSESWILPAVWFHLCWFNLWVFYYVSWNPVNQVFCIYTYFLLINTLIHLINICWVPVTCPALWWLLGMQRLLKHGPAHTGFSGEDRHVTV